MASPLRKVKKGDNDLKRIISNYELSKEQSYEIDGIQFVVESVFDENSNKTLGIALIHLMKSDINSKLYS